MGQEQEVTPNRRLTKSVIELTHNLYSVQPELNQTPSMYSQGPSFRTKPNDISNP